MFGGLSEIKASANLARNHGLMNVKPTGLVKGDQIPAKYGEANDSATLP